MLLRRTEAEGSGRRHDRSLAVLASSTRAGGLVDVSHTASLGLTLPAGLSFTSDSGVFLTQSPSGVPSAVPEPSALLLLGTGFAGLLGYGWRQRSRQRSQQS